MIPPENALEWRVATLERELREEKKTRHEVVEQLRDRKADVDDLKNLADEVHGLRRALVLFSLSFVGSSLVFLLGVLTLTQNP